MLLNRDEIREDKYFDMLTQAILERDPPRTTDLFFWMTASGGKPLRQTCSPISPGRSCAARRPWLRGLRLVRRGRHAP